MFKKLKYRFFAALGIMLAVFIMLGAGLGNLTLRQGDERLSVAEDKKVRTVPLKGTRGQITDITGIPLAYDESSYDIQFVKDPSKNSTTDKAYYTDILIQAIDIIEKTGGTTIDTFSIKRNDDGTFAFDFGNISADAAQKRRENWCKNMYVSKEATPDALYRDLRIRYRIPEEYTYEQARKLLSIWQEVQLSSYLAYIPVTICKNVQMDTVSAIDSKSDILDGIQVGESSTRIYPKDEVAAHIVGYLGKMNDKETIDEYKTKGYSPEDLIGTAGIESSMEQYLTGNSTDKQGTRVVEVNSRNKVIKERSYTPPTNGYNVRLTIDLQFQQVVEKALKENVELVYNNQVEKYNNAKPEDYDENEYVQNTLRSREGNTTLEKMHLAKSGAAVVLDVKTGKVLAMANYPSYDANLFTGGISTEDMDALNNDPARPLFNNAIASKGIPGSIFKMVTGMAGLAEGAINLNTTIDDQGHYQFTADEKKQENITGRVPACWAFVEGMDSVPEHAHQDIVAGLKNSCNYFFYETASRLVDTTGSTDALSLWGEKFGLTSPSGIELPGEAIGQVGNQNVLYDPSKPISYVNSEGVEASAQKTSTPLLVRDSIVNFLKGIGEGRNIEYTEEQLKTTAEKLIQAQGADLSNPEMGPQIRKILDEELQISEKLSSNEAWDNTINGYLGELRWNKRRTIVTGIGSDTTAVTPIEVARYIAAIANGGYVYETHVVDSVVDDNGNVIEKQEPVVFNKIDVSESYFEAIREGMQEMVSEQRGSTTSPFDGWKYRDNIAGKTGTGKVNNIDLENNAWFVSYAPREDPEIAVVIYIPNGLAGAQAEPAAKQIIEYYLDGKTTEDAITLPQGNSLLP